MKVKGFTTMELSIVMLMSGLISSMAYGGYVLFGKQIHKHNQVTEETLNTQQLLTLLKKDAYISKKIRLNQTSLLFEMEKNAIVYSFEFDNSILRMQSSVIDTFKINYTAFYTKLKNQPVSDQNNLVDEFGFTANYKKNESQLSFKKNYGNKILVEEELARGH